MSFSAAVLSYDVKDEAYNTFIDCILAESIEHINDELDKGKDVFILYETMIGLEKKEYKGFDNIFKIDGLIMIMNKYFVNIKSDLVATKDTHNNKNVIRIARFQAVKNNKKSEE